MKKLLMLMLLAIAASGNAQSLSESFDYPSGDSLTQHGWTSFSGTTNAVFTESPGLQFPGYQMPGLGNSARLYGTGQDVYKTLTSPINSGNVYCFFLLNVDTARSGSAGGDYFLGLLPATSTTNYTLRIYIRNSASRADTFAFGISKGATTGGPVSWSDSVYSLHRTYLICAKYTFNTGSNTDDQVSLYIFESDPPQFEPSPTLGPVGSTSNDVADVGRFAMRQGAASSSPTLLIDEIFVGTDWGTVLPAELSTFTHSVSGRDVILNWSTLSETNNSGFEIERSDDRITWRIKGFVQGAGTTSLPQSYSFTDASVGTGIYHYRLRQTDFNGNYEYHLLNAEVEVGIPSEYALSQNYPNPFNPSTLIDYGLPFDGNVEIELYNIQGKLVRTEVNGFRIAGHYSLKIDMSEFPGGAYYVRLNVGGVTITRKMVLLK